MTIPLKPSMVKGIFHTLLRLRSDLSSLIIHLLSHAADVDYRHTTMGWVLGVLTPAVLPRKVKVSFFLENLETVSCSSVGDVRVIFVTNDSNKTLKIPARFL